MWIPHREMLMLDQSGNGNGQGRKATAWEACEAKKLAKFMTMLEL
jgi:hypothetical protein